MATSKRKTEANRRNALASTGPKTAAGKVTSARNALVHGLTASAVAVIPGEDPNELDALRGQLHEALSPADDLEVALVERVVSCVWRLRRVARVEAGIFADELLQAYAKRARERGWKTTDPNEELFRDFLPTTTLEDAAAADEAEGLDALRGEYLPTLGGAFVRKTVNGDVFSKLHRYEGSLDRSLYKALHELERRQAERAGVNVPPPVVVDVTVDLDDGES